MSALIDHAKKQLLSIGYKPVEECEGINKQMQLDILELLEVFDKQGHSGFSGNYCIRVFAKLAMFESLKDDK